MRDSGFDGMVSELLEAGMVYAGWSAGACVAGDGMDAVALMDAPDLIAPGYQSTAEPVTGLGLVPFTIIPHFQSDHPEAPLAATAVNWAKANNINHLAMRDGDVVIRRGANIEVLSRR
jgi:dipeptidase E